VTLFLLDQVDEGVGANSDGFDPVEEEAFWGFGEGFGLGEFGFAGELARQFGFGDDVFEFVGVAGDLEFGGGRLGGQGRLPPFLPLFSLHLKY